MRPIVHTATLMCCDECLPHIELYIKRLLGQLARQLEEDNDPQAGTVLRAAAETFKLSR